VLPLFALGTLLLFVLDRTGRSTCSSAGPPLVEGGLGLPRATTASFIVGFLRRDYGAAGCSAGRAGALSVPQMLVSLWSSPCSCLRRPTPRDRPEHGAKVASGSWASSSRSRSPWAAAPLRAAHFGVHF